MRKAISVLFFVFAVYQGFSQNILYVDSTATGLNNGSSWANAFTNLDSALLRNDLTTDTIKVAKGTYKPSLLPPGVVSADPRDLSFYLSLRVTIVGGYPSGGGDLDPKTNYTVLSGDIGINGDNVDNAYHVFLLTGAGATFFGITIEKGNANGAGNMTIGSVIVPRREGGGVYIANNDVELYSVIFRNNNGYTGGAVMCKNTDLEALNCIYEQNSAYRGGAIYALNSFTVQLTNTVFYRNNASFSGGAFLPRSSGFIVDHCTFVENGATYYGGALLNSLSTANRISNSLFTGNYLNTPGNVTEDGADIVDSSAVSDIRHSLIQRLRTCDTCIITSNAQLAQQSDADGIDNVWATADDGLSVTAISDAFKAGRFGYSFNDIRNTPRVVDGPFDIGAYEINPLAEIPGNIIYVDSAATGDNSGSSWLNAMTSMQVAVNIAASSQGQIDTIKIAKGTYSPSSLPRGINMFEFFDYSNEITFDLPGNLVIMGGYSSGGSIRNPELFESILSSTTYHVVSVAYTPNVLLDGLTIKNGNANGPGDAWVNGFPRPRNKGGGILALNTSLVLNNCKISNNSTSTYGGGIACSASLLTVRDCLLSDNYGGDGAGGMYLLLLQTGSAITKSTFERNSSWQFGGAIYIKDDQNVFSIDSCVFKSNFITADAGDVGGGGIFSDYGANIKVTNSIFESNRAHHGAGIYVKEANAAIIKNCIFKDGIVTGRGGGVSTRSFYGITLVNCIFLRNQAAHQGGGFNAEGPASVDNCLFYENSSIYGGGAIMNPNSLLYVKNSLFYRNALGGNTNVEGSDITNSGQFIPNNNLFQVYTHPDIYLGNMLGADPKFADTTDFDGPDNIWGNADDGLRLALQSPLINEGKAPTDYSVVDMDITGGPRIRDRYGDIGPYESNFCTESAFINKTLYVDSSATGGQRTGKSWADAFLHPDDAFRIKRGGCEIDTIKIAKGTYIPVTMGGINTFVPNTSKSDFTIYFPDSVVVMGGYPSGGGERNFRMHQTILSGYDASEQFPNKAHVAFIGYSNQLLIDGLIFEKGGFGPGNTPHYIDGISLDRNDGKGLYAVGSKLNIQNCIFRSNFDGDGALKFDNCTGDVINTVFDRNYCQGMTAVIYNKNSDVKFTGCIFSGNINLAGGANGVYLNGNSFPSFINCTFVNNFYSSYALFIADWGYQTPFISNCIFWGNGEEIGISDQETNKFSFSLFQFLTGINNSITGIFPSFADISDPDGPDDIWGTGDDGLRLLNTSVAINKAHNDSIPSYVLNDIAGNPRINGGVVDMGAYECNCFPQTFVNRLVPVGTTEVANTSSAECGTWEFINSPVDNNKYIIEIDKNGNAFDPSLVTIDVTTNQNHQIINGTDATTLAYRMISITAPGSYTVNGGIRMRIYFDSSEIMSLTGTYRNWFKHPGSNKTIVLNDLVYNRLQHAIPIVPVSTGKINGISYVEFSNITSFSTFGYLASTSMTGALPVTFLSFTAVRKGDLHEALLTWKTDKETDNLVYEVQRSINGTDWNTFGTVTPDRSSSTIKQYSYSDVSPGAPICFYRIKQVDYSGRISYSIIRKVQFNGLVTKFNLNPNPASNHVEIINNNSTEKISYRIVDAIGKTVLQGQGSLGRSVYINTSALKQGMYWVYVNGEALKMIISR